MLASEYSRGAADSHDEVWRRPIGVHGSDVVDDGLLGRGDKHSLANDDLNDVHGSRDVLVQVDPELAGELIEHQVPAVERLQNQDLFDWASLDAAPITSKPPSTAHCSLLQTPRSGRVPPARRAESCALAECRVRPEIPESTIGLQSWSNARTPATVSGSKRLPCGSRIPCGPRSSVEGDNVRRSVKADVKGDLRPG